MQPPDSTHKHAAVLGPATLKCDVLGQCGLLGHTGTVHNRYMHADYQERCGLASYVQDKLLSHHMTDSIQLCAS
jgi:hypothetical protein